MLNMSNANGNITISNDVFRNLAGDAATGCFGVKGMVACGKDGGPWQLLRRESMSKGVKVSFLEDNCLNLELHIGVDRGINIMAVADSIVNEVKYKLEKTTGVPVNRVDVYIDTIIG